MKKKLFIAGAIALFVFTALWAAEWAAVVGTVVTPTNAPQTTNLVLVASYTGGGWSNRSVSLINLAAALRGMTTNSVYASNIFGVGGYADNNAIIYNNGGTLDGTNAFTITGNIFEILDTAYFKPGDNFDTFSYPMINGSGYLTNGIQTNRFVYIDMLGNIVVGQLTVTNTLNAHTNVNVGGDLNVTNDINMVGGTGGNIKIGLVTNNFVWVTNGASATNIYAVDFAYGEQVLEITNNAFIGVITNAESLYANNVSLLIVPNAAWSVFFTNAWYGNFGMTNLVATNRMRIAFWTDNNEVHYGATVLKQFHP